MLAVLTAYRARSPPREGMDRRRPFARFWAPCGPVLGGVDWGWASLGLAVAPRVGVAAILVFDSHKGGMV